MNLRPPGPRQLNKLKSGDERCSITTGLRELRSVKTRSIENFWREEMSRV